MRILVFTKLLTVGRFLGVVDELASRGHDVVLAFAERERQRPHPEDLLSAPASIRYYVPFADDARRRSLDLLQRARDYAWYLEPAHEVASFSRRRALERLVRAASGHRRGADPSWPDPVVALEPDLVARLGELLDELERQVPADPGVVRFVAEQEPDVVLATPLIRPWMHQAEAVKAAAVLGIPSGAPVYSLDTLSNKGCMHCRPDRVWAWNEIHRRELVELHRIDPDHIEVTGAPHWDGFFELEPSCSRAELCARFGFDADRPIVLYLGSSKASRDEPAIVTRWLGAVRTSRALRDANVLVRPHPGERDADRWTEWAAPPGAALSERGAKADQSLYDELHHADVAVGLNTSAQIEASILGKPVYTFAGGELAPGQGGSLHFYYLLEGSGGVYTYAETLAEHVRQLERGVAGDFDREAIRRFCELIVRPRGLERPVAPIVADAVLALAGSRSPVPVET
ncbi:MAG TPA: hypothetical protein VH816_00870 [Gaiellaceae bacterium]|jgi:hypothetical protein